MCIDGGLDRAPDRALVTARDGILYSGLNGAFDDSKLEIAKILTFLAKKIAKNVTNRHDEHQPRREMSVLNCVNFL